MNTESRVEALELELKILKNEIQSTLLEIREQILIHYYPELRSEEPTRHKPNAPRQVQRMPKPDAQIRTDASAQSRVIERTGPIDTGERGTKRRTGNSVDRVVERPKNVQPFSDVSLHELGIDLDLEEEFTHNLEDDAQHAYTAPFVDDDEQDDEQDGDENEFAPQIAPPTSRFNTVSAYINDDDADDDDDDDEYVGDEEEDTFDRAKVGANDNASPTVRAIAAPKARDITMHKHSQATAEQKLRAEHVDMPEAVPAKKSGRSNFAAMATWVGDSVAKVGKQRTQQVIDTYVASGGTLTPETKTSLQQLIVLATDTEPTSPVDNQTT